MESKIIDRMLLTSKAIDDIQAYSYQYNLKIVSPWDIDVAHRVPARTQDGRRRGILPIICKFTRRMVRDVVIFKRRNCNLLLPTTFGLNPEDELKISIFSHLTPRLQELFYLAKSVKEQDNYKYYRNR